MKQNIGTPVKSLYFCIFHLEAKNEKEKNLFTEKFSQVTLGSWAVFKLFSPFAEEYKLLYRDIYKSLFLKISLIKPLFINLPHTVWDVRKKKVKYYLLSKKKGQDLLVEYKSFLKLKMKK